MTDCSCKDNRTFDLGPMERKHVTTDDGDVWCCVVLAVDPQNPRPLHPISGNAVVAFEARKVAKAAAKTKHTAWVAAKETLETKKAELKAKVDGGDNLSNDDMRGLLELWVQL